MHLPYQEIMRLGPELIHPFNPELVRSASYDITIGKGGIVPRIPGNNRIELPYKLLPGDFILLASEQKWNFPCDVAGQLLLKSTVGRQGIDHMLAGWLDPDFYGDCTMELVNNSQTHYLLREGDSIAQMVFPVLMEPTHKPYRFGGRYQGQEGVTLPKIQVENHLSTDDRPLWVAGPWLSESDAVISKYVIWRDKMEELGLEVDFSMSALDERMASEIDEYFKERVEVLDSLER